MVDKGHRQSTSTQDSEVIQQHLHRLFWRCLKLRILVSCVAFLVSYTPPFDTSADVLLPDKGSSLLKRWLSTTLRWDSFHYLKIAELWYNVEYQWAFFPGVPLILRGAGWTMGYLRQTVEETPIYNMLLGHFLLSTVTTCEAIRTLYLLTYHHTQSPALSFLTGCLSLLPSSPATSYLGLCTEPWFALFSYKGMLYSAKKQWLIATMSFVLAGMFRANGVILGGFLIWGMVVEPFLVKRQVKPKMVLYCVTLSIITFLPFVFHHISGYRAFCTSETTSIPPPSWCNNRLPLIYPYVQSYYWNVGFLRYWTIQQLPNFLISAPVLLLLFYSSTTYILRVLPVFFLHGNPQTTSTPTHRLLSPSMLPHAVHAFIMTCTLFFASHTQIILRLASSMPFIYWSAARLFYEHPKWARAWIMWSATWGATSVVLWTAFLPPA